MTQVLIFVCLFYLKLEHGDFGKNACKIRNVVPVHVWSPVLPLSLAVTPPSDVCVDTRVFPVFLYGLPGCFIDCRPCAYDPKYVQGSPTEPGSSRFLLSSPKFSI